MRYLSLLAILIVFLPPLVHPQAGDGRIYVRRIEFLGSDSINDNVLRRELVQLEGAYINTTALKETRSRLERLPYVERAEIAQKPVDGASDQVDLHITITEAPARRYQFGGAYSEAQRLSGYGYFINENLLGTGQRLSARLDVSEFQSAVQLEHTEPYASESGISRTVGLEWRDIDQLTADSSELSADLLRARLLYGYKIAERQSIRLGLAVQDTEIAASASASDQLLNWVRSNGSPIAAADQAQTEYVSGEFLAGWHYDTRDRRVFPNSGTEQRLNLRVAIPGSEIEYFAVDYELSKYWPVGGGWTAKLATKLGYGEAYGSDTTALAPNLNWFAGGPDSVRGFGQNRLGPKDSLGNPYGGNLFVASQLELMMPLPEKWRKRVRAGLFYDVGNTFSTEDIRFFNDEGQALDYEFEFSELRHSAGVAAQILLPIGLLRLSYGIPLNAENDRANPFGQDDISRFQFTIDVGF